MDKGTSVYINMEIKEIFFIIFVTDIIIKSNNGSITYIMILHSCHFFVLSICTLVVGARNYTYWVDNLLVGVHSTYWVDNFLVGVHSTDLAHILYYHRLGYSPRPLILIRFMQINAI